MSGYDKKELEMLKGLERPEGCECVIEWVRSGGGYPLRVQLVPIGLACPACQPEHYAEYKRLGMV
jgi:hypothetical protein